MEIRYKEEPAGIPAIRDISISGQLGELNMGRANRAEISVRFVQMENVEAVDVLRSGRKNWGIPFRCSSDRLTPFENHVYAGMPPDIYRLIV